jgi:AcrR family transcriptional regulator
MVQLSLVSDDRRERAWEQKRQGLLAAASAVIDRDGLAGLTMQAVAEQLDCAVGTIYTYFDSKADLLGALQEKAVETLLASFRAARADWDEALAEEDLEDDLVSLVLAEAFGGFFCAASVVFADEFQLQRELLTERPLSGPGDGSRRSIAILLRLFEVPCRLLDEAVESEAIEAGDNLDRVVRWVAALDGVLLLDNVAGLDRHLFRAPHHGRALTGDLLVGWGADRADVEVAQAHVERLAARGPLAPPPEGPGYDR